MIDVDALTRPIAQDKPCGENFEYHPDFLALEAAARGKPEQHSGGRDGKPIVIASEPPAWTEVEQRALDLLQRSRDLRVAALLVRALTRTNGLAGLASGLELIHGFVDSFWLDVHPQIDPDDGDDPTIRINALSALVDPAALVADLRAATFVTDPRLGPCSIRQLEVALGLAEPNSSEPAIPRSQIEGMLRAAAENGLANEAANALEQAAGLAASLASRVGLHRSLDLEPLMRRLRLVAAFYQQTVSDATQTRNAVLVNAIAASAAPPSGNGCHEEIAPLTGAIRSRDEAVEVLSKVCDFIERTEPTNPAPLLIRRAQRLMGMNFVDILRELAPEGVSAISKIAGLPAEAK